MDPARDGVKIRGRLGVVPQQDTLDMELTVRENIIIYGRYFGIPRKQLGARADELLDFVELTERANDKVEPLSGGMKRRLTIARSLVNDPEVMLLDEPTTGLDPQARHVVWDRLYRLKRQGVTLATDDALHGRGGAALRPARRHGSRARSSPRDRHATSSSATRRARWSSSASTTGAGPTTSSYWTDGLVSRVESLPDRVLLYTDDGDAASHGCTSAVSSPRPFSSGAARSRTSSCTSRAGASSNELRRARPQAARVLPHAVQARVAWHRRDERRHAGRLPARPRRRARRLRRPLDRPSARRLLPRVRRARAHGRDGDAARVVRGELSRVLRDQVGPAVPRDAGDARCACETSCSATRRSSPSGSS